MTVCWGRDSCCLRGFWLVSGHVVKSHACLAVCWFVCVPIFLICLCFKTPNPPPCCCSLQALQEKHGSGEDLPELAKQELAAMMMQR